MPDRSLPLPSTIDGSLGGPERHAECHSAPRSEQQGTCVGTYVVLLPTVCTSAAQDRGTSQGLETQRRDIGARVFGGDRWRGLPVQQDRVAIASLSTEYSTREQPWIFRPNYVALIARARHAHESRRFQVSCYNPWPEGGKLARGT